MVLTARHAFVRGRVQGVSFRWSTQREARDLGVKGWVRNLADGRVEAWLEGDEHPVESVLDWMDIGPPAARVDEVDVRVVEPAGHEDFEVRDTVTA